MSGFWRDLRYAARSLARTPGLVVVAALSLGLGMGVNTTLFSAVKAVLFTDASGAAADRLVRARFGDARSVSYPNLQDLRANGIFADVAGHQIAVFSVRWRAEAARATGEIVTSNYFDLLGVRAAIGRTFSAPDADPTRDPAVAVLSYRYWQRQLGGDERVVGRPATINGQVCTIVGVLPEDFRSIEGFGLAPEVYVPVSRALVKRYDERGMPLLRLLGRLAPGRTRAQTEGVLAAALERLQRAYPTENARLTGRGVQLFGVSAVERLREAGGMAPAVAVVALFVLIFGTVLLIACGNVGALLLARGAARRREIAIRLALGARRRQVVRQMLAESLLLAVLGVACGWLFNLWTAPLLARFDVPLPIALPFDFRLEDGLGLLPLELVMAAIAMLLCGLAPAIASTRVALSPALKETPAQTGHRASRRSRWRVVSQVAGATMQLAIAALFLRALGGVVSTHPGFDVDRVLTAQVTLDDSRFDTAGGLRYTEEAVRRVAALPGVDAASAACIAPLSGTTNEIEVADEGSTAGRVDARENCVAPGYFRTMGIALLRGRDFDASDRADRPPVVITGETLARRLFGDGEAVGRRVRLDRHEVAQIVGVVRDSKYRSLTEAAPEPVLYRPFAQEAARPGLVLQVRTARPGGALPDAIRTELAKIEKDVPVTVRPLGAYVELSTVPLRVAADALVVMGSLGLLLALVGLLGVISHDVARRTPEFGIRLALGAAPSLLRRSVLKRGAVLVGSGVVLGLALTAGLARALGNLVAGVRIDQPALLAVPALVVLVAGLTASYTPARRAPRVDPVKALRCE